MIAWHEDFCEQLAERGFYVVRFDNRDFGRSTHFDCRPPTLGQMLRARGPARAVHARRHGRGRRRPAATSSGIDPAHVVGASMGGMIAQMLAAEHPERRPLAHLDHVDHRQPPARAARAVASTATCSARRRRTATATSSGSAESSAWSARPASTATTQYIRERAGRALRPRPDAAPGGRQLAAIVASGDRTDRLRAIEAPTLVIHGDGGPAVRPSGGKATAKAIPGARLMMIEGMGHDLPRGVWPQIIDGVAEHARAADGAEARARAAA